MHYTLMQKAESKDCGLLPKVAELVAQIPASVHYFRNPETLPNNEGRRLYITTVCMLVGNLRIPQADYIHHGRMGKLSEIP